MKAGLYVHVPFCARICPYCDFAVTTGGAAKHERYLAALESEIDQASPTLAGWPEFDTLYLGGGTPSALDAPQLQRLVERIRGRLPVADDAWLTLEANPEDVTDASARAWRDLGFRTISLGLQSLRDDRLAFLGRAHREADARAAVARTRAAGFELVSIDLMFGATGQSLTGWQGELAAAVALEPDHISLYQLTYHQGTPFWDWLRSGKHTELPEAEQADLYAAAIEFLAEHGYLAYEASNFARGTAAESRHNSKYWRHLPYLGLGPSAHSFDGQRRRWWNHRSLADWATALEAGASPVEGSEELDDESLLVETILFGTRTRRGLDLDAVNARFDVDLAALNEARLDAWRADGLVEGDRHLRPTTRGMAVADALASGLRTR